MLEWTRVRFPPPPPPHQSKLLIPLDRHPANLNRLVWIGLSLVSILVSIL